MVNIINLNKLKNILYSDEFAEIVIKQRMQCFHLNSLAMQRGEVIVEVVRLGGNIVVNLQIGDVIKRKQYGEAVTAKNIIEDVRQNFYSIFKGELK